METDKKVPLAMAAGAPPWVWLWAILFLHELSLRWGAFWNSALTSIQQSQEHIAKMKELDPESLHWDFLMYPAAFVEFLPGAALLLALTLVLLPWIRAAFLRAKFRLSDPPEMATMREIEAFARNRAPNLRLSANLLHNGIAFVFPAGFRQAEFAVLGGLYRLWQKDRPAAESAIVHELVHERRGDFLILGAGSALSLCLRYILVIFVVVVLIPGFVLMGAQIYNAHSMHVRAAKDEAEFQALMAEAGAEPQTSAVESDAAFWSGQASQVFTLYLPGYARTSAVYFLQLLHALVLPVVAIWVAELNADYLTRMSRTGRLDTALSALQRRRSWWKWLLARLTHPPQFLRRALLRLDERSHLIFLLLAFPLAYAGKLAIALAGTTVAPPNVGLDPAEQNRILLSDFLPFNLHVWVPTAVLLCVWPWLYHQWERLFVAGVPRRAEQRVSVHLACAGLPMVFAICGTIMRF